jgi:hypothetical protein
MRFTALVLHISGEQVVFCVTVLQECLFQLLLQPIKRLQISGEEDQPAVFKA